MHFYWGEIGHFEHLREQRADVFQMCENALGGFVRFASKHFITVDSEPVEKIIFFGRGLLDKPWEPGFDRVQFPRCTLKYGCRLTKFDFMLGNYASHSATQRSTSSRLRAK